MTFPATFRIKGWSFVLVLHGSRMQLEGHHNDETISRWLAPTDSLEEAVQTLMLAPTCCLL